MVSVLRFALPPAQEDESDEDDDCEAGCAADDSTGNRTWGSWWAPTPTAACA